MFFLLVTGYLMKCHLFGYYGMDEASLQNINYIDYDIDASAPPGWMLDFHMLMLLMNVLIKKLLWEQLSNIFGLMLGCIWKVAMPIISY